MKYPTKYIIPLSHAIFVNGKTRSVVCDLQKRTFTIVPQTLPEFVEQCKGKRVEEVYENRPEEDSMIMDEYFEFLLLNEFIFLSDHQTDVDTFPGLNLSNMPLEKINNSIIDYNQCSTYNIKDIIKQLVELECRHIQLRMFKIVTLIDLEMFLSVVEDTCLESIEIITEYNPCISNESLQELFLKNQRFHRVIFYNAPQSDNFQYYEAVFSIIYTKEVFNSALHCGIVHPSYFMANIPLYIESLNYNNCLNRKIGIDVNGEIKNCPSFHKTYGNVSNTQISDVIADKDFQKLWAINKDKIEICNFCEFRYICTDCRAYIQNPENQYSKPLKCGYDPLTNKWEDWSKNPLSKKAMNYYELQDIQ